MLDYGLDMSGVRRDLALPALVAEGDELEALVAAQSDWTLPTPAAGWTIAHQIAHLAAADANVLIAIRTPAAFEDVLKKVAAEGDRSADLDAAAGAAEPRSELLERWRTGRAEVAVALADIPLRQGFPWFGSELTATLMVPLRLMETWAHGQDIFETLGVRHPATDRLEYVAALGVAGLGLSFYAAQLPTPAEPFRVELKAPHGHTWAWGPEDATQRIYGSALDFCLRVTHRASRAETDLTAVGPDADKWLDIARVFL
ncbi:TIGR03084 family metal-binding protein [Nocardia sp. NBC_01503]|uniref:TIGR03084 family metal-binding protein n=1 Tax=Nocardia sp. NBC_01503 TaxID=2975997 RepID=UPI002E7B8C27|nr:TIGR03084 family metal-binding protein [Nocardia sp. NBC_01503]WTL30311.1 TIGR03084 family metal-binding protein [Nocardia sp. NBC_01503]